MSKTALFITGTNRRWFDNHELMHWIQENEVDTFACTSSISTIDAEFIEKYRVKKFYQHKLDLARLLPPGTSEEYIVPRKKIETHLYNSASMFYCHKKNTELLKEYESEQGFLYTFIAYIRTDGDFQYQPLPYPNKFEDNTVYIPEGYDYDGINDQMAFGKRESMISYCTVYDRILEYLERGVIYNPEILVLANLRFQNINIVRFSYPYQLRSNRHET